VAGIRNIHILRVRHECTKFHYQRTIRFIDPYASGGWIFWIK
jgi:hypothetical protein